MQAILSSLRQAWIASKTSLGIIFCYFIALLGITSGDLTVYSAHYLWKNLAIFSFLVIAVRLNSLYLKSVTLKWKTVEIPPLFMSLVILHGAYIPLMALTSQQESFPWYFPLLSLVCSAIPHMLPNQWRSPWRSKLSWGDKQGSLLKEHTLMGLAGKSILISTPNYELATRYALKIAQAKPKHVTIHGLDNWQLLQAQLRHDFPTLSWAFDLELAKPLSYDIIIDGFMDPYGSLNNDELTLIRIERLNLFGDSPAEGIITLIPTRMSDDQGNIIVEDYARRMDRRDQRVIPIRHYDLVENPMIIKEVLDHSPQRIKVQFTDTIVVQSLNLLSQLRSNPTSLGEAWTLTEVIQIDLLSVHKKIPAHQSFQEKMLKLRCLFHTQGAKAILLDHLTATNDPCLALVTQGPLSRKKLDGILKKISDKCHEKDAA
jgi:hypothetical protein